MFTSFIEGSAFFEPGGNVQLPGYVAQCYVSGHRAGHPHDGSDAFTSAVSCTWDLTSSESWGTDGVGGARSWPVRGVTGAPGPR